MKELQLEINVHVGHEGDPVAAGKKAVVVLQRLRRLTGVDISGSHRILAAEISSPEGKQDWNILAAQLAYIGSFVDLVAGIDTLARELNEEVIPIFVPSHNRGVMVGPGNGRWPLFDTAMFIRCADAPRTL
jgi:hypothetical protein